MSRLPTPLAGRIFGRLTVLSATTADRHGRMFWLCQCECGNKKDIAGQNLRRGDAKSCGCARRESFVRNLHIGRDRHNARKKLIRAKQIQIADLLGMAELQALYAEAQKACAKRRMNTMQMEARMTTADRILQVLSQRAARPSEVAAELGITPNTAWMAFAHLRQRGLIELVSANGRRNRVYRAIGSDALAASPRPVNGSASQLYGAQPCLLAQVWK